MQFEVAGIPVELIKKKMKHVRIRVLPPDGRVVVSAPKWATKKEVAAIVLEQREWILRQQARIAAMPPKKETCYVSGETLSVFGKGYPLRVEVGKRSSLMLTESEAVLTVREGATQQKRAATVKEWYRAVLKEAIEARLPYWEQVTGLVCTDWQIKDMKTRWGTCNSATGKLWFSLQLAKKPPECLDYVIVHELAHLKIPDHGREFWALVERYQPNWRVLRKRLNGTA